MDRKVPFLPGETYHLYSRGVEKRDIFLEKADYDRFIALLYACNGKKSVRISNFGRSELEQGESLLKLVIGEMEEDRESLVDILAYALMPNHFHLIVLETQERGVARFMHKVMTAYSMYFNTKLERSGPLFTRPFRSKHINSDEYLRWLFSYVHLNPLELIKPDWKRAAIFNQKEAASYLENYAYSSYSDYLLGERVESKIISMSKLPFHEEVRCFDDLLIALVEGRTPEVLL